MKKLMLWVIGGLLGVVLCSAVFAQESETAVRMLYLEQSGYLPDEIRMLTAMFNNLTGIEVKIEYVRYDEAYAKILNADSSYDVVSLDQLWLADLVSKERLTPLNDYINRTMRRNMDPTVRNAFQYQGRTWAVPFLVNVQLLFYNEKILKAAGYKNPPGSLEAMVEQMKAIKQKGIVDYPWTDAWRQDEGLVSEFVWLIGAFEGELIDKEGTLVFDQSPGVQALEFMATLLTEQLANPIILKNDELLAKDDFLSGRAAFTSQWLFLQRLLDDPQVSGIVKQAKMALLPASKTVAAKTSSVSAFQGIAILANSENKELAWKWIEFFTSPLVQRAFLFEMPVWESVQTSQDAIMLDPTMTVKREQLLNAHYRPMLPNYSQVSSILQTYLHLALRGRMEPAAALKQAKTEIEKLH